jgi:hypothetical protein
MGGAFYTTEDIVIPAGTMVGSMRVTLGQRNFVDFAAVDIGRWDDAVQRGKIAEMSEAA